MRSEDWEFLWLLDSTHGQAPARFTLQKPAEATTYVSAPVQAEYLEHGERVLHVHLKTHIDPQESLVDALSSLGDYKQVVWDPYQYQTDEMRATRAADILTAAQDLKPTLVFMQLQQPGVVSHETVKELRKLCDPACMIVAWCGDIGRHNGPHTTEQWTRDLAEVCDLMLYTSMTQVHAHRMRGIFNATYLQIGYEEELFFPVERDKYMLQKLDCVFFGQNYSPHAWATVPEQEIQLRREACQALASIFGSRFHVHGQHWDHVPGFDGNVGHVVSPALSAEIYRESRMALSLSLVSSYGRYTSDRLFRAMACGIPVLVKSFHDDAALGLHDGDNCMRWDSIEELKQKAIALKEMPLDECYEIGAAGAHHVQQNHTWWSRMQELKAYMFAVRLHRRPR